MRSADLRRYAIFIMSFIKSLVHPLRLARRYLLARRYNTHEGYREDLYWEERHRRYRGDFRAVASYDWEKDDRYPEQRRQFFEILEKHGVDVSAANALEFGCGNGFWCEALSSKEVASYRGYDISSAAIEECRTNWPQGEFHCAHLGSEPLEIKEISNLTFSIDVTQHVVERPKLVQFLNDMEHAAQPGSLIFCTAYLSPEDGNKKNKNSQLTVNFVVPWSEDTVRSGFPRSELIGIEPFWDKSLLVFRKNQA